MIFRRIPLKDQHGYTLLELLIVIAIIGTLTSMAIPGFRQAADDTALLKMRNDLRAIDSAIASYTATAGADASSSITLPLLTAMGYFSTEPKPPNKAYGLRASGTYQIDETLNRAYISLAGNGHAVKFYSDTPLSSLIDVTKTDK